MKLKLGSRIQLGFATVVLLVLVAGMVGLFSQGVINSALDRIANEETPLLNAAATLELALLDARNAMTEVKWATGIAKQANMSRLEELSRHKEAGQSLFDSNSRALLEGGILEDGTKIRQVDNPEMVALLTHATVLNNDAFRISANRILADAREIQQRGIIQHEAMQEIDRLHEGIIEGSLKLEGMISKKLLERTSAVKSGEEAIDIIEEIVPLVELVNRMRSTLGQSRIALFQYAGTVNIEKLDTLAEEFNLYRQNIHTTGELLLQGGEQDGVEIVPTSDVRIRKVFLTLDDTHKAYSMAADRLMSAHRGNVVQMQSMESSLQVLESSSQEMRSTITKLKSLSKTAVNRKSVV